MTGFGRTRQTLHGREVTVEIKSVNSRYFEYNSRLPRSLAFLDDALKKQAATVVARGKVDISVALHAPEGDEVTVSVNMAVARGYYEALDRLANSLCVENDVKASHFAHLPDVFALCRAEPDENELSADVLAVARQALACFDEMRAAEGARLAEDIQGRLDMIEDMVGRVEADSAGRVRRYTDRLYARLREVLADTAVDEGRLLAEAAVFADKTAVDEETVRLRSHLGQYRGILKGDGPVGRKLDFLTQELNREANTVGSKCQEVDITRIVVDMKAEIEKIREQIQNLE
jgi:uncharacterized protein (TIGR00255 family)